MSEQLRACAIVHSPDDPAAFLGVIGDYLAAHAWLEVVVAGDPLPDPRTVDVVVAMGSGRAADDDTIPWLAGELAYLREAAAVTSVLGICFGGQLLARALGGTVGRASRPEIGWCTVETDAPDLIAPGPWYEHHHDAFTVPPGAVELARTPVTSQAFRWGRSLGLQFHPEIDTRVYAAWNATSADGGRAELAAEGIDQDELVAGIARRQAANRERAVTLLDRYWSEVRPER